MTSLRQAGHAKALAHARSCYDHLAGLCGVELHDALLGQEWLTPAYEVTPTGIAGFADWGIDVAAVQGRRRSFARPCLDWTERRPHLAGGLAAAMPTGSSTWPGSCAAPPTRGLCASPRPAASVAGGCRLQPAPNGSPAQQRLSPERHRPGCRPRGSSHTNTSSSPWPASRPDQRPGSRVSRRNPVKSPAQSSRWRAHNDYSTRRRSSVMNAMHPKSPVTRSAAGCTPPATSTAAGSRAAVTTGLVA